MANRPYLLDTSALFTLIEDEDGADRVESVLNKRRSDSHLLATSRPYLLSGLIEEDYGAVTMTVETVALLPIRAEDGL